MAEKHIGLIANLDKDGAVDLLAKLTRDLSTSGQTVHLHNESAAALEAIGIAADNPPLNLSALADISDLLIVLGGDGTLLNIAAQLREKAKPLAAVNTGTLGFLSCVTSDETDRLVEAIKDSSYEISRRRILSAEVTHGDHPVETYTALNELVIGRGSTSRTTHVEARVDGEFVNHYTGDGLIVATPTGSTAYSMSAGGPIVHPGAPVMLITPVCPHTLANRAIVVSDSSEIELLIADQRDPLYLTADGRGIAEIDQQVHIKITRARFELSLVSLNGDSFFNVLKGKLGWYGSSVKKGS